MNKRLPSILAASAVAILIAAGIPACSGGSGTASAPAHTGLGSGGTGTGGTGTGGTGTGTGSGTVATGVTSLELAKRMVPGWNLGNTLEAIPNETAWGNPKANQALFNGVKAAGFQSVRIPVSWKQYADSNDNISASWMARVKEVVDQARAAGLYVMINIHWDGGWMQPNFAHQNEANARLTRFWTQIATTFKDYDEKLLFAGTNEVMVDNDYTAPKPEYCTVQKGYNQAFVDAVRATGGKNAQRHLVVQAFNTNIDYALSCNATMPIDTAANRLMMEVHYYDPFNFTINDKSKIWQWGKDASDPASYESWANEAYAEAQFQKMKSAFIDKGVPVILGEYGAIRRTEYDPAGRFAKYWNQTITRSAFQHGLVPMYWDNGYTDNHQFGLFNRSTGAQAFPDVISTIVNAAK